MEHLTYLQASDWFDDGLGNKDEIRHTISKDLIACKEFCPSVTENLHVGSNFQ